MLFEVDSFYINLGRYARPVCNTPLLYIWIDDKQIENKHG